MSSNNFALVRALPGGLADDALLVERLARAKLALLGEATHGTHEFYAERASLTQRLVRDHGFNAVVVEADWPDAWRVNRYIRGHSDDRSAEEALSGFERFPTWMLDRELFPARVSKSTLLCNPI